MVAFFEGRVSDSPFIEMVWRGEHDGNYTALCPADPNWNLLINWQHGRQVRVTVEGPLTRATPKQHRDPSQWLVIKFKHGIFMPYVPVANIIDGGEAVLSHAASEYFGLNGTSWQLPSFDNVETFVNRLFHDEVLVRDPLVHAVLQDQPQPVSFRTVRRRFLNATGLTYNTIQQINRAKYAAELLGRGVSILDTVYQAGYADQPHLTRSMRRFYGYTPAQIASTVVIA